jgi:hypothetical protein
MCYSVCTDGSWDTDCTADTARLIACPSPLLSLATASRSAASADYPPSPWLGFNLTLAFHFKLFTIALPYSTSKCSTSDQTILPVSTAIRTTISPTYLATDIPATFQNVISSVRHASKRFSTPHAPFHAPYTSETSF